MNGHFIYRFILTVIGVALFSLLDKARARVVVASCICGAITFIAGEIFEKGLGVGFISYFFSASITCLYSEIGARCMKVPVTVILLPAIIPIVPGSLLYNTMRAFLIGNANWYRDYGLEALSATGGIGASIVAISAFMRLAYGICHQAALFKVRLKKGILSMFDTK